MNNPIATNEMATIIRNPEFIGTGNPSGTLSITWSDTHSKYIIRMANDGYSPEYIGFIASHQIRPHLWYTYTKIGNRVHSCIDIRDAIKQVIENVLSACEVVWIYTRTDNSYNWEIYYVG